MLRLKRMRSPRYEGHPLPSTVHSWMDRHWTEPTEGSHSSEQWFRLDPPAFAWEGPAGVAHLRDQEGTWIIYTDRREYGLMDPTPRLGPDMLPAMSACLVAEYAMDHIRRFGDPVPPEAREELFICEAAAVSVGPGYHEFHWKSRSNTRLVEGLLRFDPEDGWVRYLEGTERDPQSGAVLHRGSTRFEYNQPLPVELFDPAAAGFRRLGPGEWAHLWGEVTGSGS